MNSLPFPQTFPLFHWDPCRLPAPPGNRPRVFWGSWRGGGPRLRCAWGWVQPRAMHAHGAPLLAILAFVACPGFVGALVGSGRALAATPNSELYFTEQGAWAQLPAASGELRVSAFQGAQDGCACTDQAPPGQSCLAVRDGGNWCGGRGCSLCLPTCLLLCRPPPHFACAGGKLGNGWPTPAAPCGLRDWHGGRALTVLPLVPLSSLLPHRSYSTQVVANQYCQVTCGRCMCPDQCACTDIPHAGDFSCAQQVRGGMSAGIAEPRYNCCSDRSAARTHL